MIEIRRIVRIDEEKCDGCGECVPSCAEGAIRIVAGKARLVAEALCDGLGACLGKCPRGAIDIEERPAQEFSPEAVEAVARAGGLPRQAKGIPPSVARTRAPEGRRGPGGSFSCPGTFLRETGAPLAGARREDSAAASATAGARSRLAHWPVQLALLPPGGKVWQGAQVLIAADCVPFAMADFHERLLAGRSLAIACPKLDDLRPHIEKLARIFGGNDILSVTVAHMEVPCCTGILRAAEAALERSGRADLPLTAVTISIDGRML